MHSVVRNYYPVKTSKALERYLVKMCVFTKVIIHKLHGELSLVEQDTFENGLQFI